MCTHIMNACLLLLTGRFLALGFPVYKLKGHGFGQPIHLLVQ